MKTSELQLLMFERFTDIKSNYLQCIRIYTSQHVHDVSVLF